MSTSMSVEQKIARMALTKVMDALNTPGAPDPYVLDDNTLLGETDYGSIVAARGSDENYWEPFDFRKPNHMAAWDKTMRTGKINFIEFEPSES